VGVYFNFLAQFVVALFLTIAVETLVILTLARIGAFTMKGKKPKFDYVVLAGIIPSAITLPLLWFVFPLFLKGVFYIPVGEILVTLIEAPIIAAILKTDLRRGFLASLVANITSFAFGLVLVAFGVL